MEWKINDLGKVGSLTVVGNMEQINEVNDFLKALANKTENEQSNCNILHVSNQREQLIAYQLWCYQHPEYDQVCQSSKVDIYLKAIN